MTEDVATAPATCPVTGAGSLHLPFRYPSPLGAPEIWTQLRDECPVAPVTTANGEDVLMLTRYDDVRTMLGDPRFIREALDGSDDPDARPKFGMPDSIAHGEGHMRWRRLLSRSFTVKRISALQEHIAELANELIDAMVAKGGPLDLRAELGFPLPVYVICELLGVPADDRAQFSAWSDRVLSLTRYTDDEVETARQELWDYLTVQVQRKHESPGDDLLSELAAISEAGDGRLSETELVATGQALLVAGHETTANMIGKMVSMLLADRSYWEQLVADRSLVRSAVEEVLRFDANLGSGGLSRVITEPIEIAGTAVEPGTIVQSSMSAANRDERKFDHPEQLDLTRSPNQHLTFGVGPHSCLGQSLARIELQTTLDVLLDRLPTLELAVPADELRQRVGLRVGGLEEVPVRW